MNKGKVIPEIRLDNFNEIWMERKFSNIVNKVSKQSNDSNIPKVEFQDIISGEGRLNKDVSNKFDDRKGTIFQPGFILYGKLRPYLNNWLYPEFEGVALGDFWVFESVDSCSIFNYYLIQSERYQTVANISSGTKMPRSDWRTVAETVFLIPNRYEEQQKIGAFFKQLDDIITLQQQLLDDYKQLKKAMLQNMFPQKGESVPRLRFAGFDDVWEETYLKDISAYKNGKGHEKNQSEIGKYELINLNSISINGGLKPSGKFVNSADEILRKNDLVMILSDIGHGDLLGRTALIPEDNRFVLNQRVALLRPYESINSEFLLHCINNYQNYFKVKGAGMSQLNLSKSSVEMFLFLLPSFNEQIKIGNFFKQLDENIVLHEQKLETYQELKKAMLQKMFV